MSGKPFCDCGAKVESRDKRTRFCSRSCALRARPRRSAFDRFWSKVDKNGPVMWGMMTPCWLWTGAQNKDGYGNFFLRGKGFAPVTTHRYSFRLAHGSVPDGMQVLHRCDARNCVRPNHLFTGTNADNMADRDRKGRQVKGEQHKMAKLTAAQVREIRRIHPFPRPRYVDTAKRFGVSRQLIRDIAKGDVWKHVAPGPDGG